jgi:hypothetical protein
MCVGGLDWVIERGGFCEIEASYYRIVMTLGIDGKRTKEGKRAWLGTKDILGMEFWG